MYQPMSAYMQNVMHTDDERKLLIGDKLHVGWHRSGQFSLNDAFPNID